MLHPKKEIKNIIYIIIECNNNNNLTDKNIKNITNNNIIYLYYLMHKAF